MRDRGEVGREGIRTYSSVASLLVFAGEGDGGCAEGVGLRKD